MEIILGMQLDFVTIASMRVQSTESWHMSIGALQKTANTLRSTARTLGSLNKNIATGKSERRQYDKNLQRF